MSKYLCFKLLNDNIKSALQNTFTCKSGKLYSCVANVLYFVWSSNSKRYKGTIQILCIQTKTSKPNGRYNIITL